MNTDAAEQCMEAFKKACDQADQSTLISSEECHYWVFEQGYKAAMQQLAAIKQNSNQTAIDLMNNNLITDDLMADDVATKNLIYGFNLLNRFKLNTAHS